MHNKEDLKIVNNLKDEIMKEIIGLLIDYGIDITQMNSYDRNDLIIALGKLCYEYRQLFFAIGDYEDRIFNEVNIDTDQFCNEEDIY